MLGQPKVRTICKFMRLSCSDSHGRHPSGETLWHYNVCTPSLTREGLEPLA